MPDKDIQAMTGGLQSTMLAARAHHGSDTLVLDRVPMPEPGPLDVVIRVASAGLARGMLRLLRTGAFTRLPTIVGHEAAGTISAVGADVEDLVLGDRVRVHPVLNCRSCTYCRSDRDMMCPQQALIGGAGWSAISNPLYARYHDGGLTEYLRVPHWLIDRLPDTVSFDVAAKVHDVANAVRVLKLVAAPLGATVVVTAPTGTMGTATVKLAAHFGIGRLILVGRDAQRLKGVAALSGPVAVDTVTLDELAANWADTGGLTAALRALAPTGADGVIDYVPDGPVTGQALAALATGGTLAHMGANDTPLTQTPRELMADCWRFVGTRGCTRNDVQHVLSLLDHGALELDELITHRYPLTDIGVAFDALQRRHEPIWMAVVNPQAAQNVAATTSGNGHGDEE